MSDFCAYEVVLRVRANDTYEALLKYWIKDVADEGKLRQSKIEWSRTGAKHVRQLTKFLRRELERRKRAGPALSGAGPELQFPSRDGTWATGAAQKNQKVKLELGLSELRSIISQVAKAIAELDDQLFPYWCAKNNTEASIMATHGKSADGLFQFTLATAGERKPMFDRLLALAEQWGSVKIDRAELNTLLKGYEREARRIEAELIALRRKERSRQHHVQA